VAYTGNFRLGPDAGRVVIKTSRAGLAAKAGHDLTIEFTRWSAQVQVPDEAAGGVTAAQITADLDLGSREVRVGTGGAQPLNDRDRRDIKKTMSGILGTGQASFASSKVTPFGASGGAVEGTLTLNGQTQPVRLQLNAPGEGRYRGSATVPQSAFGIKPYSGFFGALKLRDEVTVEFDVDLSKAQSAEPPASSG
jgi:polyisoprenoid-binding protein YceI